MALESKPVTGESIGSLQSCLVEGDPEQRLRERRVQRRALVISIAMQSVVLAALVVIPLFARPARIVVENFVPLPPYYHTNNRPTSTRDIHRQRTQHNVCRVCPTAPLAPITPTRDRPDTVDNEPIPGIPDGPPVPGQIPLSDGRVGLRPPPPPPPQTPRLIHTTHIDPALLTHRV